MSFRLKYDGDEINERLDKAGTALQEHQDISHLATKKELSDGLDKKQDIIEDLESIRENASKGATALQSVPSEYVTESELDEKGFLTKIPDEYVTESELKGKGYLTEHQSLVHLATKSELESKVDKVIGKQLSTEDFTTLLKSKLESLKNYDDTELVSRIDTIQETIDTLFSKDASSAIESFNEIIAFLEGVEDSENIDSIIASIEQQIADVAKVIPSKVSELENDKGYLTEHQDVSHLATREELESGLATKQDTISDLETIRNEANKVSEIIGADGYLYSNGEKVDMRFTRSLLPVGTSIPASANLNTIEYLKIGKYYCSLNVDAKTIKNCPTNMAFSMEVFNPLGTNIDDETTTDYTYRLRILTPYNTGIHYIQCCKTTGTPGTWTYESWYVTPRSKFTLASSKNDGSAAIGATNKGVYIDSDGEIKAMSYTVAKSVPSNAVFTDTNTKVTAVGNHYTPSEDEAQQIDAPSGEVVTGIKRDAAGHVVGVVTTPQTGGITVESDPVFSASPAASITEEKISSWDSKQDTISDLETIRSGAAKGATALQSYTEKYTGTYSKPSTGIPKTDLASTVQTSLDRADTALQSVPDTYATKTNLAEALAPIGTLYKGAWTATKTEGISQLYTERITIPAGTYIISAVLPYAKVGHGNQICIGFTAKMAIGVGNTFLDASYGCTTQIATFTTTTSLAVMSAASANTAEWDYLDRGGIAALRIK